MFVFNDVKYKKILEIPNLTIEPEKIITFVGASGSGKTTVLRLMNKIISPTEGSIFYDGEDLKKIPSIELRRKVMMLSQNPVMFGESVKDSLIAGFTFQQKKIPDDQVLYDMLEMVRLKKNLEDPVGVLSGGEKQRLALGRILLLDPEVYLFDEPSSALDEETEEEIIKMLADQVKEKKKTMIMVTHSKGAAERYGDEIIEMANGKILNRRSKYE
ncbi:ABC transporter ATP-binding protein [Sinanaerobacter chloroacetimidivorans]|jgi:putative ABC transport system ATP-binding protein|uniref:ABC transporter ATP-binding protein n=1 Tax=Sinanaerobacter chloroacetimidivorans TaxID=2818044 RepID=A0A8J7W499_9FIRM|nr:ABC transporter ATP-binding protein [Sinanaerobacter chloroacetimidivorans]MBR0600614.1 ABC transporter ATP-binding protein [Sinanaerobacter chloroacetimidivorans]